jgi:hypothetical protein
MLVAMGMLKVVVELVRAVRLVVDVATDADASGTSGPGRRSARPLAKCAVPKEPVASGPRLRLVTSDDVVPGPGPCAPDAVRFAERARSRPAAHVRGAAAAPAPDAAVRL